MKLKVNRKLFAAVEKSDQFETVRVKSRNVEFAFFPTLDAFKIHLAVCDLVCETPELDFVRKTQ